MTNLTSLFSFEEISVVLVTFNSDHILANALESIPAGCDIIVVDNASSDESSSIADRFNVRVIQNKENLGFGAACNIGAAASDRKYVLFFNPDAVLQGNALEKLMETLTLYGDAAAVGPRFVTQAGRSVWRYKSILHPQRNPSAPVIEPEGRCCMPLLTGAAMLCRRDIFESIGGFDENIFMYFEDDDLSKRLVNAGSYLIYEPEAEVLHDFGMSSGQSFALERIKNRRKIESKIFVMKKYGISFCLRSLRFKAIQRLAFSIVRFDAKRIAASLGTLDALKEIRRSTQTG